MKVAIVADSPTLTTGSAVTTSRIGRALTAADHEVVYFGLKVYGRCWTVPSTFEYLFRTWTIAIDFDLPGQRAATLLRLRETGTRTHVG